MPKIPDDVVKRVIDRAKIEDVVGEFVDLRKMGVNLTGLCPFHDDKTDGNFIVRPSTIPEARGGNTYHCFVCMRKGEGGGPVDFLMKHERLSFPDAIRWLGKKYNEPVDDIPLNYTPPPPRPKPAPLPVLEIPRAYVRRTMDIATERTVVFVYWLRGLPWDEDQRARLQQTLWMYCVGGWRDGRVVFWMIDHDGVPRAAKMMKYMPDGHRDKEQHPGWIYNQPGRYEADGNYRPGPRDMLDPDHHTILKPLFGSHLLKRYQQAVVNIVESEKTAIIMTNYYGNPDKQLWLACGGLKHLQLDSLQPLIDQGRTIWLWPDKDGRDDWQEVCEKLGYDNCRVYTHFFDTCWTEADGDKADVADIAIRMMRTGDKPRKSEELRVKSEEFATAMKANPTHEPVRIGTIIANIIDDGQPFLDPEELADPRLRMWRETLRQRYNFNKRHKQ